MPVFLLATLDTKGAEAAFVKDRLEELGVPCKLVDVGCLAEPTVTPDVPREDLFAASGANPDAVRHEPRGRAVALTAQAASILLRSLHDRHMVQGVISIGGSAGTTIGTAAMRSLPLGLPKLMVSTLASGQVRPFVGDKDILMMNAVVDIAGINRISRLVLGNAAAAMAGMVMHPPPAAAAPQRPLLAATMFGVTTPCVEAARAILEQAGYEVLVFHATGNGGQAMESLIREGMIVGVLDITTTELADELVGGVLSAGPTRLTAAGDIGIPQLVSVGALDMVNFGPPESVPEKFRQRTFHRHNPTVTLMRTTPEECVALGREIATKLSQARGEVAVLLPRLGVSALDRAGAPFEDATARESLFRGLREHGSTLPIEEVDLHINDPRFAQLAAGRLLAMLERCQVRPGS